MRLLERLTTVTAKTITNTPHTEYQFDTEVHPTRSEGIGTRKGQAIELYERHADSNSSNRIHFEA